MSEPEFHLLYESQIENTSLKNVFYETKEFHYQFCSELKVCGVILEQTALPFTWGLAFNKQTLMGPILSKTFDWLLSAGIPQAKRKQLDTFDILRELEPPKFLSINDINFAFIAASVAYGIASVVFLLEISYPILKIFVKDFVGLFYFVIILTRRLFN